MKNTILLTAAVFGLTLSASANGVIVLEGHYQGKNLYVQNPFAGSGAGFCVFEVKINGNVTTDEVNSSAFEVDFVAQQLNIGDPVEVRISHKGDCKPKVLNPEVLKPKSTFETLSISVANDGTLTWSTKGEMGKLPYMVEQFRWNKWVNVGEVEGKGTSGNNQYSFKVVPHSGENQFRVKQVDYTGKPKPSPVAKYRNLGAAEVTFAPVKVSKDITFSSETMFEIYDSYGNVVKKGFGTVVDVSNLPKGLYYINFDNKTDQFMKK